MSRSCRSPITVGPRAVPRDRSQPETLFVITGGPLSLRRRWKDVGDREMRPDAGEFEQSRSLDRTDHFASLRPTIGEDDYASLWNVDNPIGQCSPGPRRRLPSRRGRVSGS